MIIGLHGLKGSGKDTVYEMLKEVKNFRKIAFADPIKEELFKIFQINEHTYDTLKRISYWRHIFREIGMLMKSYNENQFIKYVDNKINNINDVIITDVRFLDELNFLKSKRAILIKIKRFDDNVDRHETEKEINDEYFDYIIDNTKDINHLKKEVEKMTKQFKIKGE